MPQYHVQIDRSLCDGFGSCVETAPEAFALGPDGIAVVLEGGFDDSVFDAAQGCPTGAIDVVEVASGEQAGSAP